MSKNITVQEGGIAKQLTADKLRTNLVGGGTCLWVPENEIILGTKSITNNGSYSASADGLTGFSQVNVNVQGDSVTGRDPVTGQEKTVTVDPETGDLVETVVPSEIRVIAPPTNPYGTYIDGQTITKDGMVVKAYDANGDEMQTVPIGELSIAPTIAVYDASKDRPGGKKVIDTPLDIGSASIYIGSGIPLVYYTPLSGPAGSASPFPFGYPNSVVYTLDAWKISNASIGYYMIAASNTYSAYVDDTSYTYNGKTVYYKVYNSYMSTQNSSVDGTNAPLAGYDQSKAANMAWSMIFGEIDEMPAGSPQTINVSWPRPGDGKLLEATFDINVGPRAGQGDD